MTGWMEGVLRTVCRSVGRLALEVDCLARWIWASYVGGCCQRAGWAAVLVEAKKGWLASLLGAYLVACLTGWLVD